MERTRKSNTVFVADSCIGGLSVVNSCWNSGNTDNAVFLADYAVNPLGVKSDAGIADVVQKWLELAVQVSDTLLIACNTLSIRYHQLVLSAVLPSGSRHIVSMVDCFKAMVEAEADRLANNRVLIIGTAFTAGQALYPEILRTAIPDASVDTVAATELERAIARFEPWEDSDNAVLTDDLRRAVADTDVAVLACTCFPLVRSQLESLFPDVVFLDPGAHCADLLNGSAKSQARNLRIEVTGDSVEPARVIDFARSYLGDACSVS